MKSLLHSIRQCQHCADLLPQAPNPILSAHPESKIIVVGQAPGRQAHLSQQAWNDKSGDRLRDWLGVDRMQFYDDHNFALMPMAFCFPGTGTSGDFPPPKACAPKWHQQLLGEMKQAQLLLLIGNFAQQYYLKHLPYKNLSARVRNFENFLPKYFPLPHPSPRNNLWLRKNPWMEDLVVPKLREIVYRVLSC
ncbi:uracil-DNA glycosylase family protein [Persicobacter diffluens]|uniref:uracil-DNA glycosylase family protein n=1 Tax=Persicobacter diffluens TaxID=981 RepID=UPI0030C72EE5